MSLKSKHPSSAIQTGPSVNWNPVAMRSSLASTGKSVANCFELITKQPRLETSHRPRTTRALRLNKRTDVQYNHLSRLTAIEGDARSQALAWSATGRHIFSQ
jgi:hypothetical protein